MAFLDQELNFDMGHLLLLIALVGFIFFVANRCKLSCDSKEGLDVSAGCPAGVNVDRVHWKSCRCADCEQTAYDQARKGELYGCNANNPYVPYSKEECNYSYRKAALHGCGVA